MIDKKLYERKGWNFIKEKRNRKLDSVFSSVS